MEYVSWHLNDHEALGRLCAHTQAWAQVCTLLQWSLSGLFVAGGRGQGPSEGSAGRSVMSCDLGGEFDASGLDICIKRVRDTAGWVRAFTTQTISSAQQKHVRGMYRGNTAEIKTSTRVCYYLQERVMSAVTVVIALLQWMDLPCEKLLQGRSDETPKKRHCLCIPQVRRMWSWWKYRTKTDIVPCYNANIS